jgi:hypothetical protein
VVLHHEHFLPKGSSLTFYTHANNQLLAQNYIVGHDCMLRCSPGTTDSLPVQLEQRKEYMQYLLSGRGGSVSNVMI